MEKAMTIRLEFTGLTADQAQHILEAAKEAESLTTHQEAVAAPAIPANPLPAVQPAQDDAEGTAPPADRDSRGVPYNSTFHNPRFTADGNWAKRRNHDKEALAAFEAPHLAKAPSAAPQAAITAERLDPNSKESLDKQYPGITGMPSAAPQAATLNATTPEPLPTIDQYKDLWVDLCRNFKVTGLHQAHIEKAFGAHPCADEIVNDVAARSAIWKLFQRWNSGDTTF